MIVVLAKVDLLDPGVVPITVALVGALVTAAIALRDRLQNAAARRRDRYAEVAGTLAAWCELPFRLRRRTSNSPEVLAALADRGHDLQEQLARHRSWVTSESKRAGAVLDAVLKDINWQVTPALQDAWLQPPVTAPEDMNLAGWGPGSCQESLDRFQREVAWRFGLRRALGLLRRHPTTVADGIPPEPDHLGDNSLEDM